MAGMYYCINEIVQLFRLLTKKRNENRLYRFFLVNTGFFGVYADAKLFPIVTKLLPTGGNPGPGLWPGYPPQYPKN